MTWRLFCHVIFFSFIFGCSENGYCSFQQDKHVDHSVAACLHPSKFPLLCSKPCYITKKRSEKTIMPSPKLLGSGKPKSSPESFKKSDIQGSDFKKSSMILYHFEFIITEQPSSSFMAGQPTPTSAPPEIRPF